MGFIKRLLLAVVVLGAFCAFLIGTGKWDAAVVGPVRAVLGQQTANEVDNFGKTSGAIAGKAADLGQKMYDGYTAGGTPEINAATISAALDKLKITPDVRIPSYDRAEFGVAWADVDGNGCDTRNDILARDLTSVTYYSGECVVASGTLADPYTATTINFVRGTTTSSAVQIDHVVPLSLAWQMGAYSWTETQRAAFANDPAELLAVDGPTNSAKGDSGPSDWMPPSSTYQCAYVAQYTSIALHYNLTIPAADKASIEATLAKC